MVVLLVAALVAGAGVWWVRRHPAPFPPALAALLEHPLRLRLLAPDDVVRQLDVAPGHRVLEIGPGGGAYTAALARAVRPICLDLQPAMLRRLRDRLGAGATVAVCGDGTALPLADASVDRILMVTVLGELPDRAAALGECRRVLRPGGLLLVAESLPDPDFVPRGRLAREARAAGFTVGARRGGWACYAQALW